jgi:hypothetical protein
MNWDEYTAVILVRVRLAGYTQFVRDTWAESLDKYRFQHKHILEMEMMLLNREEGGGDAI